MTSKFLVILSILSILIGIAAITFAFPITFVGPAFIVAGSVVTLIEIFLYSAEYFVNRLALILITIGSGLILLSAYLLTTFASTGYIGAALAVASMAIGILLIILSQNL